MEDNDIIITEEKQEEERIYKIPEQGKDNSKVNERTEAKNATGVTKEMDRLDIIDSKLDLLLAAQKISME